MGVSLVPVLKGLKKMQVAGGMRGQPALVPPPQPRGLGQVTSWVSFSTMCNRDINNYQLHLPYVVAIRIKLINIHRELQTVPSTQ